ncbi:hypothetical protein SAMN04515671_3017 [Nakamurella panacisegetis]|uniref:Cell division protein FtsL n=1 Tax=Nakamurella panacisegetis TaxID=1090615 RepID=A0A1H0QA07_9ACTN|nr:hypothetical protein [Nakamurella panacisegetis]SDP13498.1 hypothetical protein SAMN04515671_3017 [Nakamurella panacisegetis]
MTAQETERIDSPSGVVTESPGRSTAAGKAYARRTRRQQPVSQRLTATGSPISAALARVPFVALIILLLAGGIVGVLYLNTVSDAAGLQASVSRRAQMDLNTRIEAANKDIADLKNPARLAAEAQALGLVPAGDAAIMSIGADGKVSILGTPTPVPAPVAAAPTPAATPSTTPAASRSTSASSSAPATTTRKTTAPVRSSAPSTAPAKTTAAASTAAKSTATTAGKTTPARTTAKTTPAKTTPAKTTPAKTTPAKTTPVNTTPARATTTTGAGR